VRSYLHVVRLLNILLASCTSSVNNKDWKSLRNLTLINYWNSSLYRQNCKIFLMNLLTSPGATAWWIFMMNCKHFNNMKKRFRKIQELHKLSKWQEWTIYQNIFCLRFHDFGQMLHFSHIFEKISIFYWNQLNMY